MNTQDPKKVKVLENGPYEVTGNVPLDQLGYLYNENGASTGYEHIRTFPLQQTYHLCRCGRSNNKPYCDGSHSQGFYGKETATHRPYEQTALFTEGKHIDMLDAQNLCAVARFCDTNGTTWDLVQKGDNEETIETVIRQCCNCPSGRLTAVTKDGKRIEPELAQEISILEDTVAETHGPIWLKGGITVEDANGRPYAARNRMTLCRCGKSRNKPFCDARNMEDREGNREEIPD